MGLHHVGAGEHGGREGGKGEGCCEQRGEGEHRWCLALGVGGAARDEPPRVLFGGDLQALLWGSLRSWRSQFGWGKGG